MNSIADQLILHEGISRVPYIDTLGNWTTGCGYNLEARGWDDLERVIGRSLHDEPGVDWLCDPVKRERAVITRAEAVAVLHEDIVRVERAVKVHLPIYTELDPVRQKVVLDMAFNLGFRALGFKKAIAAVVRRDWSAAAMELYRSKWAYQVDDGPGGRFGRADRLAGMLLTGRDYER